MYLYNCILTLTSFFSDYWLLLSIWNVPMVIYLTIKETMNCYWHLQLNTDLKFFFSLIIDSSLVFEMFLRSFTWLAWNLWTDIDLKNPILTLSSSFLWLLIAPECSMVIYLTSMETMNCYWPLQLYTYLKFFFSDYWLLLSIWNVPMVIYLTIKETMNCYWHLQLNTDLKFFFSLITNSSWVSEMFLWSFTWLAWNLLTAIGINNSILTLSSSFLWLLIAPEYLKCSYGHLLLTSKTQYWPWVLLFSGYW